MADYENKVVSHISVYLDKTEKNLPAYVYAKQYDSNSRYIVARVLTESGTYVPPEVCQLNATKPDGNMAYVEGEVNADNTVSFLLTSNLLACHGTVSCDISFFSGGEKQALLTTSTFYIIVGRSNFDADAVESTTEEMIAIIAEAKAAGDAAQEIADEVQRKLDDGEFIGPPGPKGDPGESLKGAGEWDSTKSYSERSMVSYSGSSYMAITDVPPGVLITDDYYWMLVARSENVHLVEGPVTDTTAGTWTGTINGLTAYYEGLVVIYVPHVAGANTTRLNINGLGAKLCTWRDAAKCQRNMQLEAPSAWFIGTNSIITPVVFKHFRIIIRAILTRQLKLVLRHSVQTTLLNLLPVRMLRLQQTRKQRRLQFLHLRLQ